MTGPWGAGGSSAIMIQDGPHRTGHAAALPGPYRWKALESAANETQADIRPVARTPILMLLNLLNNLLDKRVLSLSFGPPGGFSGHSADRERSMTARLNPERSETHPTQHTVNSAWSGFRGCSERYSPAVLTAVSDQRVKDIHPKAPNLWSAKWLWLSQWKGHASTTHIISMGRRKNMWYLEWKKRPLRCNRVQFNFWVIMNNYWH